jgi:excisionase family DNA binding protein
MWRATRPAHRARARCGRDAAVGAVRQGRIVLTALNLPGAQGVNDLDLGPLMAQLTGPRGQQAGLSLVQASIDVGLYRCFLLLAHLCPGEPLVPSPRIDHVWHVHMLDTRAYLADCRRALGGVLCHQAVAAREDSGQAPADEVSFARTHRLALDRLGVDIAAEPSALDPPGPAGALLPGHGWRAGRWEHPAAVLVADDPAAEDRLKTVAEVAELTRLSRPTIYRLIDSGGLDAIRIGGTIRIPESALHARLRQGWRAPDQR